MSYQALQSSAVFVVHLPDQFDSLAVEQLRELFTSLAENENSNVEFDFSRVTFIDSSAIGAVVFLYKRLTAQNREISITGAVGQPLELMQFLRIDKVITLQPNLHI